MVSTIGKMLGISEKPPSEFWKAMVSGGWNDTVWSFGSIGAKKSAKIEITISPTTSTSPSMPTKERRKRRQTSAR